MMAGIKLDYQRWDWINIVTKYENTTVLYLGCTKTAHQMKQRLLGIAQGFIIIVMLTACFCLIDVE